MRKFLMVVFFLSCLVMSVFAETTIPSVDIKEEPYFLSLGFSFKGPGDFTVTELNIFKLVETKLKDPKPGDGKAFRCQLVFGDEVFPVKIVNPELKKFEADIMEIKGEKGVPLPIGHVSFKLQKPDKKHTVAVGKLIVTLPDKEKSGEYSLFLNELPLPSAPGSSGPAGGAGADPSGKK